VIVLILIVLYFMSTNKFLKQVSFYLPPAAVMMLAGLALGSIFEAIDRTEDVFDFNSGIFFNVLLPPIIFHAGQTVPKQTFFRNIASILSFALFGTMLSSVLMGSLIYAARDSVDIDIAYVDAMVLGSLLSAVDPVSTISVFSRTGVHVNLYTLVFGESIVNDAMSIVIYRVFKEVAEDNAGSNETTVVFKAFGDVLLLTIGSLAIGVALGVIVALVTKHSKLHTHPPLELALLVLVAYLSFILAEELETSGIMSTLFASITMNHYADYNITPTTKAASESVFTMLADIAESFVFVYLGMACFTFGTHNFKAGFTFLTLAWCLLSRAIVIFPISFVLNLGRKTKIKGRQQFVMWLSGLRGAVAFALAIDSPASTRDVFVTTTLVIVFITTFCFGGLTYPVLTWLKLTKAEDDSAPDDIHSEDITPDLQTKHWFVSRDRE